MSFTSMAESIRNIWLQRRILPPMIALLVYFPIVSGSIFELFNVSYDHRALIIAGKRRMIVSAGIHYPRATPEMWSDLIRKSKEGGADVIQTYVFWNGQEPVKGQIDACNSYYCDGFKPNLRTKPVLWTEDWDGCYTKWGGSLPHRPAEDLAFAVARFYQREGSFQNYYMWFGGTNFGRTYGGSYYLQAMIMMLLLMNMVGASEG